MELNISQRCLCNILVMTCSHSSWRLYCSTYSCTVIVILFYFCLFVFVLFFCVWAAFTRALRRCGWSPAPAWFNDFHPASVSPSQAGTGWLCSAREPPRRSVGSLERPSPITKSTSWRSASCTRSTCPRPTGTRLPSSWAWRTRRSSRGFRTGGPS